MRVRRQSWLRLLVGALPVVVPRARTLVTHFEAPASFTVSPSSGLAKGGQYYTSAPYVSGTPTVTVTVSGGISGNSGYYGIGTCSPAYDIGPIVHQFPPSVVSDCDFEGYHGFGAGSVPNEGSVQLSLLSYYCPGVTPPTRDVGEPPYNHGQVGIAIWPGFVDGNMSITLSGFVEIFYDCTSTGPVETGISPSVGPKSGGTRISVTGSGLTGATDVLFGTDPAKRFTVTNDTSIDAVSPSGTPGTSVEVIVLTRPKARAASDGASCIASTTGTRREPAGR